ncbi:unnamed protein product [Plutella xylostella]|uniref:(diamondback moth) hypothetical protein n=1 Tax=Plutella xylostella TaxID=51655 RepID=A0A8S4E510_PLUXY|nr:unnamed protein product [Plutella xylostella]
MELGNGDRNKPTQKSDATRTVNENQAFMEDLKKYRNKKQEKFFGDLSSVMGPKWYQILSPEQIKSLDTLTSTIHDDILEGRPTRTAKVLKGLGIMDLPNASIIYNCVERGQEDPKKMFAHLFRLRYNHNFDLKRRDYDYNAKLMLSALYHLGRENLVEQLKQRFAAPKPEPEPEATRTSESEKPKPKKTKPKEVKDSNPYAQPVKKAEVYVPPVAKRPPPPPLPDLDVLDEPYEDEPLAPPTPPPPPPPPPPKKRLASSICDKVASIQQLILQAATTETSNIEIQPNENDKREKSRMSSFIKANKSEEKPEKKKYGMNFKENFVKKKVDKKPKMPETNMWNHQHHIVGVHHIEGKPFYVLGNIHVLPPLGPYLHLGITMVKGEAININGGVVAYPADPTPEPCDCMDQYYDSTIKYLNESKCKCGHYYDFYHEGPFPDYEPIYFHKPTPYQRGRFDYENIFEFNETKIIIKQEFEDFWETDSVVGEGKPKKKRTMRPKAIEQTKQQDVTTHQLISPSSGSKINQVEQNKSHIQNTSEPQKIYNNQGKPSKYQPPIDAKPQETNKLLQPEPSKPQQQEKRKSIEDETNFKQQATVKSNPQNVNKTSNEKKQTPSRGAKPKRIASAHNVKKEVTTEGTAGKPKTCLGDNPQVPDYLKCSLRLMRRDNLAARLPDLHLAPELHEWMRHRLHGPLTPEQKEKLAKKTQKFAEMYTRAPKQTAQINLDDPLFSTPTTWADAGNLKKKFENIKKDFKMQVFLQQTEIVNTFWASMNQTQTPNERFRQIFFAYLQGSPDNVHLFRPYNPSESEERYLRMNKRRYRCPLRLD